VTRFRTNRATNKKTAIFGPASDANPDQGRIHFMTIQSLTATNLTCQRGGRVVFRALGFAVGAGHALALEGANGAGKSSLLRMLAGFIAPAAGSIVFSGGGSDISEGEDRAKQVGWLGHLDAAKPQMTVRETLAFFGRFYAVPADDTAITVVLENVGLARLADLPCQYLSAGQKKRLALARLQFCARPVWLMDEPLAALDTAGKSIAANLIASHCARGGIAVVATHEPLGIACERLMLGTA
jgi:heme exporter protein A